MDIRLSIPSALLLTGCYTYRPVTAAEPAVGSRVSAELTRDGSQSLAALIGPDILHLEGRLLRSDTMALDLGVAQVENGRGIQYDWNGEEVNVPRRFVAGLQQRRLSVGASALMAGLVGGALYAAYELLGGPGIFSGRGGNVGGGGR